MAKLTETYVKRLKQADKGTRKFWDSEIKGLCVFVGKQTKTWYFQRDVGGRTTRKLIGRYPTISAVAARQAALSMALDMSRGAGRVFQIGAPTLAEAMEVYLGRKRLRSEEHKENVRGMIHNHLSDWLRLPLDEIDRRMVVDRHASLADRPSLANHLFRAFPAIWNAARRSSPLSETPTIAIEWHREKGEGGIIDDLTAWRGTVEALDNPIHTAFYQLLLFTGLRKTEAAALEWRNVHKDRLHIPMTKNGRSFDLPLLEVHHEILEPLRDLRRDWVFPSPKSANGHLVSPSRLPWSCHAHRRTFATVGVEAGVLEEVVGRLLNHTPQNVTGSRYVKPSLDAMRPAMKAVTTRLVTHSGWNPPV